MSADHQPGHESGDRRAHAAPSSHEPDHESLPAGHAVHAAHAVHPEQRFEERARWVAVTPSNARRIVATALAALVLLWVGVTVFQSMSSFLFLLLLAWLLSIAMEPIVLWLSRRGVKRGLATGLTMLAMVLVFAGLAELFGAVFASQLSQLGTRLPEAAAAALDWVNATFHTTFDLSQLQQALSLTPDKLGELAGKYGGGILGVFGSVLTFAFDALTILVFAYYLSADSPRLRQTIGSWLPQRYQRVFVTVWTISVEKTGGYVVSKLLLATLSSVFHAAFFWFVDVPFWLPLGIFAGIVGQFIPTIGTYIGVALPALFTLLANPLSALWIVIFATVYQQIENYVFTPRISQRTMDVHPAVALGAVIAGAAIWGPIGALIGIPIAAVALAILDTFSKRHELLPELADLGDEGDEPAQRNERAASADAD
ncbi:AI-2E family transporter [Intrasporangium flavum]|uniref:AI-2E family transporter n=1 Tax=Intrasporangium flavum TaxID=1428657 RepID=UPI00096C1A8C|nr:AI-2E family transporter [Intrasporangium flavum]